MADGLFGLAGLWFGDVVITPPPPPDTTPPAPGAGPAMTTTISVRAVRCAVPTMNTAVKCIRLITV